MKKLIAATVLSLFTILASSCATKSEYVLPTDARKLNADEITRTFSNVKEEFESVDDPGLTASIIYISDGGFSAVWDKGWFFNGSVKGNWYTDGDKLCVKTTTKIDGSDLYCVSIYVTDEYYTAVHSDGSYQGISTLTPMGNVMNSEQLHAAFIGNTLYGKQSDNGSEIESWYYFNKNGKIYGRSERHGNFEADWEVRDSGCLYTRHPNKKYDGCYYYIHDSGSNYRFHRPWSDEIGQEIVIEGNPEQLGEESKT